MTWCSQDTSQEAAVEKQENETRKLYLLFPTEVAPSPIEVARSLTIGRAPDNDIVLPDSRISKHHARIEHTKGRYTITDLHSRNGTLLDGVRIGAGKLTALRDDNIIEFCGVTARVHTGSSAEALGWARSPSAKKPTTQLMTHADLASTLNEQQRAFIRHMAGEAAEDALLTEYTARYLADPLATVLCQNAYLADSFSESVAEPAGPPEQVLSDFLALNARTERLFHPEAATPENISTETYTELKNVLFTFHGDIFPSHLARLDDPSTFNYRELLVGHKYKTEIQPLLVSAKAVGVRQNEAIAKGSSDRPIQEVFEEYARLFSRKQETALRPGEMVTVGYFSQRGGSCRHRSAALQLMMQEAGIRSRYVRGFLIGGGQHAWVEVAGAEDGDYELLFDPNFLVWGKITERRVLEDGGGKVMYLIRDGGSFDKTRASDLVYMMIEAEFNTVWRPQRRTPGEGVEETVTWQTPPP